MYYASTGLTTEGYDPYYLPDGITRHSFDLVVMTYVLNVIPDEVDRVLALQTAFSYVAPGGSLVVATRHYRLIERQALQRDWDIYNDGYITSLDRGTFQKGFVCGELSSLLITALNPANLTVLIDRPDTLCISVEK